MENKDPVMEMIQKDIEKIQKLDPGINSIEDLEGDERILESVKAGNSLYDAYFLANRETIIESAVRSALEGQKRELASRDHLTASRPRGEPAERIPQKVLELYKELLPECGREEYSRGWKKYSSAANEN